MARFQFSLRDLFLATTLIAVGAGGCVWLSTREIDQPLGSILVIGCMALIGAGCGAPFHQKAGCGLVTAIFTATVVYYLANAVR